MNSFETTESKHRRLRWLIADLKLDLVLRRLAQKYSEDQLRDDGGRWVDGGGGEGGGSGGDDAIEISSAKRVPSVVQEFGKWTARQYVSRYCQGSINRELPGEFEDMTISDIWNIARGGDARARTCLKLLKEPRFRK